MTVPAEAYSKFLRSVARAIDALADDLLDEGALAPRLIDDEGDAPDPAQEHTLGTRQRQIVSVPGLANAEGMKTSDIAKIIDYEVPNTYTTLQALVQRGIVEQIPDKVPQTWRLARRYRANTDAFKRIASHVQEGEWTTYGDISIAVLGTHTAARGVGRAAATDPDFPAPHRVLKEGGSISPEWHDDQGRGPEECRRRLEADGVDFTDEGRADPARRVPWDELLRRDALSDVA